MGVTRAVFQSRGRVQEYKDRLYTWVRRGEIRGAANLKSLVSKSKCLALEHKGDRVIDVKQNFH